MHVEGVTVFCSIICYKLEYTHMKLQNLTTFLHGLAVSCHAVTPSGVRTVTTVTIHKLEEGLWRTDKNKNGLYIIVLMTLHFADR